MTYQNTKFRQKLWYLKFVLSILYMMPVFCYSEIKVESTLGPMGATIFSFYADTQSIYIGTNSGVISSLDKGTTFVSNSKLESNPVLAFLKVNELQMFKASLLGLHKSTDGGKNWNLVELPINGQINFLFRDSIGNIYALGNGIVKSKDNGKTWSLFSKGLPEFNGTPVISLHMQIEDEQGNLYAGSSSANLKPRGLYKLVKGSDTWNLDLNMNFTIKGLTSQNGYIYVVHEGKKLSRSSDFGNTWTEVNTVTVSINNGLRASLENELLAITSYGLQKSIDNGKNWEIIKTGIDGFGEDSEGNFYHSDKELMYRSLNRGVTWEPIGNNVAHSSPNYLLEVNNNLQAYTNFGYSEYSSVTNTWSEFKLFLNGVYRITNFINDNEEIYIGLISSNGVPRLYSSSNNGVNWSENGASVPSVDSIKTIPKFIAKYDNTIYLSSNNGIFKSNNVGLSWQIDPILKESTGKIAVDTAGVLYALSKNFDKFYLSKNSGATWIEQNIGPLIYDIAVSKTNRKVYVAAKKNVFDPNSFDGIYRTDDSGEDWSFIGNSLPKGDYKKVFSSKLGYLLTYMESDNTKALYFSRNEGKTWLHISAGVPEDISVNNFTENDDGTVIYISTIGAGVYRLIFDPNMSDEGDNNTKVTKAGINLIIIMFFISRFVVICLVNRKNY